MALISGAFLPIQAGLNSRLGKAVANPIYASLFSFIVGAIGLTLYILISRQSFSLAGIKSAPASIWLGGLLGAFYVTVIILAFPHLGPGLTFGLVIAGQMLTSILLEHFNVLVAQQQNISLMKIVGVLFVIIGVIIIRKF